MASLDQVVAFSITVVLGMMVAAQFRHAAVDRVRQQLFEARDTLFIWWAAHGKPEHRRAYELVRRDYNVVIRFAGHLSLGSALPVLAWRALARNSPAVQALDADARELDAALAEVSDEAAHRRLMEARSQLRAAAGAFILYGSAFGIVVFVSALVAHQLRALWRPKAGQGGAGAEPFDRTGRDAVHAAKAWRETDHLPLGAAPVS